MSDERDRALVIGAGVAGLLAASVLADRFRDVVVVERDRLPVDAEDRGGVPQGRHLHGLLSRGLTTMDELLPGFSSELIDAGASAGDLVDDTRLYVHGRCLRQAPSDLRAISCTRALLEHHLRRRVRSRENVSIVERRDVTGLAFDQRRRRVTGVRLLGRDGPSTEEVVEASLVVDASGRTSRAPAWLEVVGQAPPPVTRVAMDLAYASRRYRIDRDALNGDVAIIVAASPAAPRAGAIVRTESGTATLTVAGVLGDRPPLDPAGFDAFTASLAVDDIRAITAVADPIHDPVPFRFPASVWHHYERVQLPTGFLPIGDALCSFNPIYGQGMTVAALEAGVLADELDRHGPASPRLPRRVARCAVDAWRIASGADLQFPGVEGHRSRPQRWLGRYVTRLQAAAAEDAVLSRAFHGVTSLVEPPATLLRPSVVMRVARHRSGRRAG